MASDETNYLQALRKKRICPYCGNTIKAGQNIGTGDPSKGVFCSLDCFAKFYELELAEKAALLAKRSQES